MQISSITFDNIWNPGIPNQQVSTLHLYTDPLDRVPSALFLTELMLFASLTMSDDS